MNAPSFRPRRLGVGVAVGALLASTPLLIAPAAHAATIKLLTESQVDLTQTRATGHNDFTDAGVHVYTESNTSTDKAAGYFDVGLPLADAGEPSMAWTANEGPAEPGMQLRTDFDGDGNVDGSLVGETVYGNDWWVPDNAETQQFVKDGAPSHTGGSGSSFHGTLDQWRAAFPDAEVIEGGWSLGSGVKGDGVISRLTIGEVNYYFRASDEPTPTVLRKADVDTSHTRANGHNVFLADGGLHVYTDGNSDTDGTQNTDKAAGYFDVDIPLEGTGTGALDFTNNVPEDSPQIGYEPGLQLVTDFDGDGIADGTLVGEPLYPGLYWLAANTVDEVPVAFWLRDSAPRASGQDGAPGYSAGAGSPAEWRLAFPNARILQAGYSLGSAAYGDGVINSITIGDHVFTFAGNRAPSATPVKGKVEAGSSASVTLKGTDPDGDPLTYDSPAKGVRIDGDVLTFSAGASAAAKKTFRYTATDPDGAKAVSTVTFKVKKASTTITIKVKPVHTKTTTKKATVTVKVISTGNVKGGKLTLRADGHKYATKKVGKKGVVKFTVKGPFAKGRRTLSATYAHGAHAVRATGSLTVNVQRAR